MIYGLGVFGANSAATFETGRFSWSHGRQGYLSQMDWGYALALNSHIRGDKSAEWKRYLTLNVKHDFEQGQRFIMKNPEKIFRSKGQPEGTAE